MVFESKGHGVCGPLGLCGGRRRAVVVVRETKVQCAPLLTAAGVVVEARAVNLSGKSRNIYCLEGARSEQGARNTNARRYRRVRRARAANALMKRISTFNVDTRRPARSAKRVWRTRHRGARTANARRYRAVGVA